MSDPTNSTARPDKGCCGTCGWLAKRVRQQPNLQRDHLGVFEVEADERNHPTQYFQFVPGESNATKEGELTCFRNVTSLRMEMVNAGGPRGPQAILDDGYVTAIHRAAEGVIWKDRNCPRWDRYEAGVSPPELLRELRVRELAAIEDRRQLRQHEADQRLTRAAIWLASIIGVAQIIAALLTMGHDSVAYRWLAALWSTLTGSC